MTTTSDDMTDSQIFRYVEWCMDHRIPRLVAAIPLIVGYVAPAALPFWLGWWGIPLAVGGFAGNSMMFDFAGRAIRRLV